MEVGDQKSLTPTTNVEQRAQVIAQRILASPVDYDILCFMEVFDEDGRKMLVEKLRNKYPHIIEKSDDGSVSWIGITAGGLATNALLSANLAGLVVSGAVAGITLFGSQFEDSGLMLFSKLPFATVDAPQEFIDAAAEAGVTVPKSTPITEFEAYRDTAGSDGGASKGVLYVQIPVQGRTLHLMLTHTQADTLATQGVHHGTRHKQLQQAFDLLSRWTDPATSEVLFVGDFNIDGMRRPTGDEKEWTDRFATPGSPYFDVLLDAWNYEQSPGEDGPGRKTLPPFFDRGWTAHFQRLDYAIRSRGPSRNRLLLQHMAIAREIANDAAAPTIYTSDHLPLIVDLNDEEPHGSVLTAELVDFSDGKQDQERSGVINAGQMHWYRIDEAGGYRISITDGQASVGVEVYTADDLSVPVRPFRTFADRLGNRFVLPTAPFYLRVFRTDRTGRTSYKLLVHRFSGTGPDDAVPLLRNVPVSFKARQGAPHSPDRQGTSFDELDTIWFIAPFDTYADGSLTVTSTVTITSPSGLFGGLVLGKKPQQGAMEKLTESGPGGSVVISVSYALPMTGYILAQRHDPTFQQVDFTVTLRSDVSYLYGDMNNPRSRASVMARLFCHDETDGIAGSEAGSDDIQVNVHGDGKLRAHIPHSDDLEFNDEGLRDLPQIDQVRYVKAADVELVELDGLSAADRASVAIRSFDAIQGDPRVRSSTPISAIVGLEIVFDKDDRDGVYELQVTISSEPPPQL